MVKLWGIIDNISEPKKVGDKKVVEISLMQKEPGQKSQVKSLEVWSDNDIYTDAVSLSEGQSVQFIVNDFCERFENRLTGRIKYKPLSFSMVM